MNDYKFVRNDLSDKYGVLKLQNKILEMMVYIDEFCDEHNIKYFLMGGSALGAMRHGGFIPWDDDLDIFMDRENYLKFIECAKKDLDTKRFYLQCEDTKEHTHFFTKIRMNNTTCIESFGPKCKERHQGMFVDIMCLNNAPKSKIGKKIQYYAAGLLKARAIAKTNYVPKNFKQRIQLLVSRCLVWGLFKRILLYLVRRYNKKTTMEVAHLFGRAKFKNSFYKREWFATARKVSFENVELAVPCMVEEYLSARYGEKYMDMPSEETKKMYATHAMLWDTEKDYKEYLDCEKI